MSVYLPHLNNVHCSYSSAPHFFGIFTYKYKDNGLLYFFLVAAEYSICMKVLNVFFTSDGSCAVGVTRFEGGTWRPTA